MLNAMFKPLLHAAGQLEGIHVVDAGVQVHLFEQPADDLFHLRLGGPGLVHPVDVLELLADGVDLAEAVHRALEHHRDLLPAQLAQGLFVAGEQVGVVEPDVPLGLAGLFRQKAQKGVDHGGLARAGLADDAQAVARVHREGDVIHRPDLFFLAVVDHAQVFYVQFVHAFSYFLLWSLGFMA